VVGGEYKNLALATQSSYDLYLLPNTKKAKSKETLKKNPPIPAQKVFLQTKKSFFPFPKLFLASLNVASGLKERMRNVRYRFIFFQREVLRFGNCGMANFSRCIDLELVDGQALFTIVKDGY